MVPYGVVGSFAGTVIPRLAERAGRGTDEIGKFELLLLLPTVVQFLYAPIVDVGPKRKHWLVIVTLLGAAALFAAFQMTTLNALVAFGVLAQLISGLVGSCVGGLMAIVLPDDVRGRGSSWYFVGNMSGGAASAWAALYMFDHGVAPTIVALTLVAMMVIPSLFILKVTEPERDNVRSLGEVLGTTAREARAVIGNKKGLTSLLLCASPVGTAALLNLFSGMTGPYHASDTMVELVNGPGNAALTAVGSLIGGWICDRYNRRVMYLLSGTLIAVVGTAAALSPMSSTTYAWSVLVYFVLAGFCWSAFGAVVLDTIGEGGKTASTQYAMFFSAGNAALAYMAYVDSRFSNVFAGDAILEIAGVIVLGLAFWRLGLLKKKSLPA